VSGLEDAQFDKMARTPCRITEVFEYVSGLEEGKFDEKARTTNLVDAFMARGTCVRFVGQL